ncbi:MAG: pitrilysin family protein [Patescibacteria group bacterium]|nr:insulinase family protein [Patescibacteria group bacterium]MBU1952878.1 insulinase family protein [Patescibacteria group bacterium]
MRVPKIKKLKNGLRICVIPRANVDSVTIHLKGFAGSSYENASQIGAAHLLEHLNLLKGNKNKILINGGKILGVTSRDDVLYMVKVLKEDVLDGLEFLFHIFDKNDFSSEDILIQKKVVIQEIKRSQNIPERLINSMSYKILFPNDRLSIKNTGYENSIRELNTKNINFFQERRYTPNNFVLVLCGNVSQNSIVPYIENFFCRLPKGKRSDHVKHKRNEKRETQRIKMNGIKQNYIKIDFYGYKTNEDRKYSSAILALVLDTFLKNLIREKLGYVYGISCNSFSTGTYGLFSISLSCEKEKVQEVIKVVFAALNNIQKIASVRNIEHVKKRIIADFKFRFEKTSQIAEFYSDLLLHGNESQNHLYELKAIKKCDMKNIVGSALEIISQEPKITLFTS